MSQSESPIDRLEAISECLRLNLGLADDAAWLLAGVQRHVSEGVSLDVAFGLRDGSGARSPRFRRLQRNMAMHLREALWYCGGSSTELARQITRFDNRLWPIYRSKSPNPDWSPLLREIDAVYRIGKPPVTAAGIAKLLHRAWR